MHDLILCTCCPGADCSQDYDGCQNDPCSQFNSNCSSLRPEEIRSNNGTQTFRCDCPPGYRNDSGLCVGKTQMIIV